MASNNTQRPNNSFYDEVVFTPLISQLRGNSSDSTPVQGEYVGFYENIQDMIEKNDDVLVANLRYDSKNNAFILTYADETTETIQLVDKYLLTASYNYLTSEATFVLKTGEIVKLNLNDLKKQFYTKEEIDKRFDELDSIKWNHF